MSVLGGKRTSVQRRKIGPTKQLLGTAVISAGD